MFLRAINLGARRQFRKDDIVRVTQAAGFTDVATHINTGNVRVGTRLRSRERVESTLEAAYLADRGFEVPSLAFTPDELRDVVAHGETLLAAEQERRGPAWAGKAYVSLLREEPDASAAAALEACSTEAETAVVRGRAAYLMMERYGEARLTNVAVERHAGVATSRGLAVLAAVVGKWC